MMTSEYRIAISGIGAAAEMHAISIREIDNARVVAGSCRTEETGREFADTYDCTWYADNEEMFATEAPDLVIICTPSGAHLEPILLAAEHGIDVLCEKPLEITTERIDRMISSARDNDISIGTVFQQRYNPVVQTVHSALKNGRFGDLAIANGYVPWWRNEEYYSPSRWQGTQELDGGGALMNQAIHTVDVVQWFVGTNLSEIDSKSNPVAEVFAHTDTLAHDSDLIEVEDTAAAVLRFKDGTVGQLLGTTSMYPGSPRRVQIGGRDGTAEIRGNELITWQFRDEQSDDEVIRNRFGETSSAASDPMATDYPNHRRNISAFLQSLDQNTEYMLDVTEARKSVEIIEGIYESAERNEPVSI